MIGIAQSVSSGSYSFIEFYTDNSIEIVPSPSSALAIAPGCADPVTGVALFPGTSMTVYRSSSGTYESQSLPFTTSYIYNIPGVAFYAIANGTGKMIAIPYNENKTSIGTASLLSSTYLGAGPFDVSDQYFHTVTPTQVSVYTKASSTSRLEESEYSAVKSEALISSGQPQFINVVMTPDKNKLILVNLKGATTDDYDAVIVPISAGEPMAGVKKTFNITRNQGVFYFIRVADSNVIVPAYARIPNSWPASYIFYYNDQFLAANYNNMTPIMDVVYSPVMNTYYGVSGESKSTAATEQTLNGIALIESSNPASVTPVWSTSTMEFPSDFWSQYRLGYLTVLK